MPRPVSAQWTVNGVLVCGAASNQFSVRLVRDGSGGAIVSWYDHRNGDPDVYARRVLSSGMLDPAWPVDGRPLCTAVDGQYFPVGVSDGSGGAIVAWHDFRSGSTADIFAQHVLSTGAVDPAWPVNGRGVCTASDEQLSPDIVADGAGGAIVTWRDYRGGPDTDVYAQRLLASGVVDPAWPVDGRALCTAPENQSVPVIASDGSGGAIVAWSDIRNGLHSDIYAQRVRSSGAVDPAWPAEGRALCAVARNQSGPAIVDDGAGGAIVAWFDYRSGVDADIYAHHVLASGALDPAWPAEGRALCTAPGEQYTPLMVGDGAHGVIVVWYDYRGGAEADIYAQHVTASGIVDPAWPADGRALCVSPGDQLSPAIISDDAGGAIVVWYDYRDGTSADVYAQRVLASGGVDPAWPANGRALCTADGEQHTPAIVTNGAGGGIAAWSDFRGGVYSDVYAQRVPANGLVSVDHSRPVRITEVRALRPNPSRGEVEIHLELSRPTAVTVEVFAPTGRRVQTLVPGTRLSAGVHRLTWDGTDALGEPQDNGVYLVGIRDESSEVGRKIVLLR